MSHVKKENIIYNALVFFVIYDEQQQMLHRNNKISSKVLWFWFFWIMFFVDGNIMKLSPSLGFVTQILCAVHCDWIQVWFICHLNYKKIKLNWKIKALSGSKYNILLLVVLNHTERYDVPVLLKIQTSHLNELTAATQTSVMSLSTAESADNQF